ncbi:MAG: HEAT repeat domain-containing protein [Fimbriimonadaceae bacterium]|nr:HEAT repeat domain-containing protein [Fimbriimonadaceae bacterium]QYK54792.1 MAG: HEAT repeat domain-containing protein [Fimbriimonadaceae bacterium]
MSLRVAVLVAAATLALAAHGQLSAAEKQGLADAMLVGNLRPVDLKYSRQPFQDKHRMPLVAQALGDPLATADTLLAVPGELEKQGLDQIVRQALAMAGKPVGPTRPAPEPAAVNSLPVGLREPVGQLVAATQRSDVEVRAALAKLTPSELRELIEGLPTLAVEEPKVKFEFVKSTPPGRDRLLQLMDRVDLAKIQAAGAELSEVVVQVARNLREAKEDISGPKLRLVVNGLVVVIGGRGPTVHDDNDARITIDLGGDDLYTGRCGAGVGYSSVLIDVGGDDRYFAPDLSVGAGVCGVGIAYDMGGQDIFRGRSLCFGAGVCGVGLLRKDGGHDRYDAVSLSEGFGFFGVGVLLDTAGDDDYRLRLFGQGAARTQGVGWLADLRGDDSYRAGGLSMNEPLFTGVSYSFAQGFASGFREDTGGVSGGIGLLTDFAGQDVYTADTYAQGSSYWFSLGVLWDGGGRDTYSAYHYAQASAMHCTAAFLFDLAGDDSYIAQVGASQAIGHDYGVAMLLDRAGNDVYSARDGQPGLGVANGLGIFVDSAGQDRYEGPPGQGNASRGTGSLGVFVDLAGPDSYGKGLEDFAVFAGSTYGVSIDLGPAPTQAPDTRQTSPLPVPGSKPKPSDAEMEKIYAKATQWGVGSAEKEVAENVQLLQEIGLPAFEWMLDHRLAQADRLQIRAFVAVAKGIGIGAAAPLGAKALKGSKPEILNVIRIATDAEIRDIGALIGNWLEDPDLKRQAATAAGPLKAAGAVPGLMKLCLDPDPLVVRAAMASLNQIGSADSGSTAQAMVFHQDFLTRMAALELLSKFPDQAKPFATSLLNDPDEFRARVGIQLLGKLNDGIYEMGAMLLDPRPGVRLEALRQLDGRCPEELLPSVAKLRQDPIPVVAAAAMSFQRRR